MCAGLGYFSLHLTMKMLEFPQTYYDAQYTAGLSLTKVLTGWLKETEEMFKPALPTHNHTNYTDLLTQM